MISDGAFSRRIGAAGLVLPWCAAALDATSAETALIASSAPVPRVALS